jgi:hypothetical protein
MKLFVPTGTFVHASGGETASPRRVNLAGISAPSANAGDERVMGLGSSAWAKAEAATSRAKIQFLDDMAF